MANSSALEIRIGAPENVLEVQMGSVEVDIPRSIGYYGGLVAAMGLRLIEPPLALFIAAVPIYKILTNTAFPRSVRIVGEVLEGAAQPVGSDAEGVIVLQDQHESETKVIRVPPERERARSRR
jgi:hypothetical protein